MAILRLIASILKAVPVLGRLFLRFADEQKEKKAQTRYEEKLDHIDDAVDKYHRAGVRDSDKAEQCGEPDAAPPVPDSSQRSPGVDKSGAKKSSGTRVHARKKVTKKKKKRKTASRKKPSPTKKKGQDILEEGK